MARTAVTPTKSTAYRPVRIGRTDAFYQFRKGDQQDLDAFLTEFFEKWNEVKNIGVTEMDGIIQLVQILPVEWQGWASVVALNHIVYDPYFVERGNLLRFIAELRGQNQREQSPPPGEYPPMSDFLPSVHYLLREEVNRHAVVDLWAGEGEYEEEESEEEDPEEDELGEEEPEEEDPEEDDPMPEEAGEPDPAIIALIEPEVGNGPLLPDIDPIVLDAHMILADDIADPIGIEPAVGTPENVDMEDNEFFIDLDLYDQHFA